MYLIDKDAELSTERLAQIIQSFETKEKHILNKYYNYYQGNQEIMRKQPSDIGKPCNKVITNYCYNIVQNYVGYISGIDITYRSANDFKSIQEVLDYNDVSSQDAALLRDALIFGVAYEINYIDEDMKQRFKLLDPRECITIYDNTLNQELRYVVRYYVADTVNKNTDDYIVEVYGTTSWRKYKSSAGFSTFSLLEETPHYYGQVPITVFYLNSEHESIFDKIISLQDAYNKLLSSEIDDFEAFCDAYLVLKGCTADEEDMKAMKKNRILILDADAEAQYLTKSVSDTQIENMLKNINDTIHKISNSPDFSDEKLLAQSGIAMRYKLVGFENTSASIVSNMTKALQKRIELICHILNLAGDDKLWRDVEIIFTRNLPVNVVEIANMINSLRGIVSDATLIAQLPFIADPRKELELLKAEQEQNMALYNFPSDTEDEEVNE